MHYSFFADASALIESARRIRGKIQQLDALPLEAALREYLAELSRTSGLRLEALIQRFGFSGSPSVTLERAASRIKITRERMRQLQERILKRIPDHPVLMPALDKALELLAKKAPLRPEAAARLLAKRHVSKRPFHPLSILEGASLCRRAPTFEIARVRGRELVVSVSDALHTVARTVLRIAYVQASASGTSNVLEVVRESKRNGTKVTKEQVRQILEGLSDVHFLAKDWFWRPNGLPKRNRLRNVSRRMLSVSSPLSLDVIREGLSREYAYRHTRGSKKWRLVLPPRNVLKAFFRAHPEFRIDEKEFVSSTRPLDYRSELGPSEQTLLAVLRSSPSCLLSRNDFAKGCMERGMNENTFSVFSSYSPIIDHLGADLWTLRGVHIDPAEVEALREANAARPRQKRIVDCGRTPNGSVWMAVALPESYNAGGGVFLIPSSIRPYIQGQDFAARTEDGSPCGTIRTNGKGMSWGYAPFLSRNRSNERDLLVAEFDVTAYIVTLRQGSKGLLEKYRSET